MLRRLIPALIVATVASPAAALDCTGQEPFKCLKFHTDAELDRLDLSPNEDQAASFRAIDAFPILLAEGPEAAVADWEKRGLPVYDLVLTLLLADRKADAKLAVRAATKPFGAIDANGENLKGDAALAQMQRDLRSYYHGEEDMAYARACVDDEAFRKETGGGAALREGACRVPYDADSVRRTLGLMQLMRGVSRTSAVEAAIQYAYRVPSCAVATAVIASAPNAAGLAETPESAAWRVLDMTTICAAENLAGMAL